MRMERARPGGSGGRTQRYQDRHEDILDAAAALINSVGAQAMTFADVARTVGLNTTSVTYYFKRKEQLALACYHRSIGRYDVFVARAEAEATPEDRVRVLLSAAFADLRAIREGAAVPHAVLSEIRTLDDEAKREALDAYRQLFGRTRAMLRPEADPNGHARLTAHAHILLDNLFWLPFWIDRYDVRDFPRVEARMADIMLHGIAAPISRWTDGDTLPASPQGDGGSRIAQDDFLRAATGLINERGYRGASVDRIAAQLNVTKGSFYHHLDTKDDLVRTCFRRSFAVIAATQHRDGGSGFAVLCGSIASLLHRQFGSGDTLLRTIALQALPPDVRSAMIDEANGLARRYAGILSDGIADGSVRAVDSLIAAHMIMTMVDSAYDLRWWAARQELGDAVEIYAAALLFGIAPETGERLPSRGSAR